MIYFITAIDTGVGKTVATGLLARSLAMQGKSVITAKLVQTGCKGVSEDIIRHREIMGIDLLVEDLNGDTCGYVFAMPASPHLAARQEGKSIDIQFLKNMAASLEEKYDIVLLEGAGGIMVPLSDKYLTIDLAADCGWPLIIVTGPRLGSINHTLLTFEAVKSRNCEIAGVVYNLYSNKDSYVEIVDDTRRVIKCYLHETRNDIWFADMPAIDNQLDCVLFENVPFS